MCVRTALTKKVVFGAEGLELCDRGRKWEAIMYVALHFVTTEDILACFHVVYRPPCHGHKEQKKEVYFTIG